MKKIIEIFIVVFVWGLIIYSLLYTFYFETLCEKFSWNNINQASISIKTLAQCKDSIVCESSDVQVNSQNIASNWTCEKKQWIIFTKDFYLNIKDHILNSITK